MEAPFDRTPSVGIHLERYINFPSDMNASDKLIMVNIPHVTLDRPFHKVLKGCLSEVHEILEAAWYPDFLDDNVDLKEFLNEWDGETRDDTKLTEELVDLMFYLLSVLVHKHNNIDYVNHVIQNVIEKNYKRGYYTTTSYDRDSTRGY